MLVGLVDYVLFTVVEYTLGCCDAILIVQLLILFTAVEHSLWCCDACGLVQLCTVHSSRVYTGVF